MKTIQYSNLLLGVAFFFCSMGFLTVTAQTLDRSVVAVAGQTFTNATYSLQFTMGEAITQTLVNGDELSQGFQQEWLVVTAVEDPGVQSLYALVYPNPTFGKVNIETEEQVQVNVFDALGHSIQSEKLEPGKNEMDITRYAPGFYILVLQNKEGNKVTTFKLQKVE